MTRVEADIDIRAPIEMVFSAITDPRRASEWNDNVTEVTNVSDYPVRQGSTWRQVTIVAGRPTNLNLRVASFRPPYEGLLEITGGQKGTIRTQCEKIPGGTRVRQVLDFVPPGGALGRLAAKAIGPVIHHELAQALERQKAALERETAGAYGSRTSQ
jgi:uncharacterized protein YndB with AHSA1/START domain